MSNKSKLKSKIKAIKKSSRELQQQHGRAGAHKDKRKKRASRKSEKEQNIQDGIESKES